MTDATGSQNEDNQSVDHDGLLSRLSVIEDQPLESRAAAFAQVHEELQAALEGSDHQR